MFELYIKENCAYSSAVMHAIEELGMKIKTRNVANNRYAIELIERGGKFQVPALYDSEEGTMTYESGAIMDYLDERYEKDAK